MKKQFIPGFIVPALCHQGYDDPTVYKVIYRGFDPQTGRHFVEFNGAQRVARQVNEGGLEFTL